MKSTNLKKKKLEIANYVLGVDVYFQDEVISRLRKYEENRQTLEVKYGLYNNEFKLAVPYNKFKLAVIQMAETKTS
ncbi:hypothetical protein F8M41_022738 [Gigaspora margarita]|uniref:Uncharacterized protein n=1 Tax=Gigaspora margarita TaxID=4874 RepID=A0A8H4EI02_GIGMA|nr:hypothetical protein F8M41_022738 [Gigaspora margarita]